jgi:HD-like signal output (HDOD) protein
MTEAMSSVSAVSTPFTREKLLQVARSLPADLQVLSQLGEMLQDVNSELDEIAALLRRDVALATRIVRIGNSPMFGGGGQIASIEDAVNRVGFSEILKLVGTATAARFSDRAMEYYGVRAEALRDNMLYGAFAAEALARAAGMDARVAYTAGLLRTLGQMVLDRACRGQLQAAQRYSVERWPNFSAWEGSIFGVNSCEVTALILDEWRFPVELGAAIRAHYLARSTDSERPLAVLLNIANGLAHRVKRSFAGEASWWEITPQKLRVAGLSEDDLEAATASTEVAFDAATAALAA